LQKVIEFGFNIPGLNAQVGSLLFVSVASTHKTQDQHGDKTNNDGRVMASHGVFIKNWKGKIENKLTLLAVFDEDDLHLHEKTSC
jgi:hypothetical protein